jgi:hypothetical protein
MFQRDTKKFHKINKKDVITEEQFTSKLTIFGIKLSGSSHSYNCEAEGGKDNLGFQPNTK